MKKRWVAAVFAAAFIGFSSYADSLAIQIIQDNLYPDRVYSASSLFEQNVIDYFFEKGKIVSNSPIYINSTNEKNSAALKSALSDTKDGGMDYLVRIQLTYKEKGSTNPEEPLLNNIEKVKWINYSAYTGKEISNGEAKPEVKKVFLDNENGLTDFARQIAFHIEKDLSDVNR